MQKKRSLQLEPITLSDQEVALLPMLRDLERYFRQVALIGPDSVHHFRRQCVRYVRMKVKSPAVLMELERILEKQYWNLRRLCGYSIKEAVDCLSWGMYDSVMMARNFNKQWHTGGKVKIPPFAKLYHSPIYPFPNIALKKWERKPQIEQRIEKLRKMYFDDRYIDDWIKINRNCRVTGDIPSS